MLFFHITQNQKNLNQNSFILIQRGNCATLRLQTAIHMHVSYFCNIFTMLLILEKPSAVTLLAFQSNGK